MCPGDGATGRNEVSSSSHRYFPLSPSLFPPAIFILAVPCPPLFNGEVWKMECRSGGTEGKCNCNGMRSYSASVPQGYAFLFSSQSGSNQGPPGELHLSMPVSGGSWRAPRITADLQTTEISLSWRKWLLWTVDSTGPKPADIRT